MKREVSKDIEVSGRRWRIEKFNALTGSYICIKLMAKISGIVFAISDKKLSDLPVLITVLTEELSTIAKHEFIDIQRESLMVVKEIQNVGGVDAPIPILMPDGKFSLPDLEYDAITTLALVCHVLAFNLAPFFEEGVLKGAFGQLQDILPQNTPI